MPKTLKPSPATRRRQSRRRQSRRRRIGFAQRQAIAERIEQARRAKGWTRPRLAQAATNRLKMSSDELKRGGMEPVTVHVRAVESLEAGLFTYPFGNPVRRARLLGIVLALDLDRAEINLIAGGI